jgi:hypothetical protein
MQYDVEICHVMFRVSSVVERLLRPNLCCGDVIRTLLLWAVRCVNIHAVYDLGTRCKILLSLLYTRVPSCPGVVAWFRVEPVR